MGEIKKGAVVIVDFCGKNNKAYGNGVDETWSALKGMTATCFSAGWPHGLDDIMDSRDVLMPAVRDHSYVLSRDVVREFYTAPEISGNAALKFTDLDQLEDFILANDLFPAKLNTEDPGKLRSEFEKYNHIALRIDGSAKYSKRPGFYDEKGVSVIPAGCFGYGIRAKYAAGVLKKPWAMGLDGAVPAPSVGITDKELVRQLDRLRDSIFAELAEQGEETDAKINGATDAIMDRISEIDRLIRGDVVYKQETGRVFRGADISGLILDEAATIDPSAYNIIAKELGNFQSFTWQKATNPEEKAPMKKTINTIETRHFVNGIDLRNLDVADRVQLVSDTEAKIAELKAVKTDAGFIKDEVAKLENLLKAAVDLFDKDEDFEFLTA